MRFIDFFAGIGGISLGLERAGHTCVGHCEIDPYACKVLKKHWPDVPLFGDITKVEAQDLPQSELWAGGFPCQDISNAGKREGIRGSRSGLFFDFMQLVRKVRPKYLLMENVAALLSRGLGDVLGELAESGYDAEWEVLPASAFGAWHIRSRVFIGAMRQDATHANPFGRLHSPERQSTVSVIGGLAPPKGWQRLCEPAILRDIDGFPGGLDELQCRNGCLGNAVVPQVAEYIGKLLMEQTCVKSE